MLPTRLTDTLYLYENNSSIVLSFLHYPEVPALKETSKEVYELIIKNKHVFTFYGLSLPEQNSVFYELFHDNLYGNYDVFEQCIAQNQDQTIDKPYASRNENGEWILSMYRATIHNKTWNNLTLMEVAYMLGDFNAYCILQKYNRTSALYTGDFFTKYLDDSIKLLEKYDEYQKKKKLLDLR